MPPLFAAALVRYLSVLPSATLLASLALCPRACAQQPSGHSWTVTSTQQGTWSCVRPYPPLSGVWDPGPIPGGGGWGFGDSETKNGAVDGAVTSTLTWTPAAGKTLQTDPAPNPLFVLEHGYARWASLWGNSPSPPTQADAVGSSVADGFGDPPVFDIGNTSAISSGYRLEQRGFSSGSCTVSDTLSSHNPTFSQSGGYPTYVKWTGGQTNVSFAPYPIVLSAPDPAGFPNLGDGTNQFVYSADKPDGYLYVPGAIQVVGGYHDASEWLINNNPIVTAGGKVDLKIEAGASGSVIPNVFTHQWAVSDDTIYVNTPQDTNNPYPGYQFNHWIFKGLPSSFSTAADGNHDVNLYVQGTKSQTAHIQTFYQATANNYPQAATDYANYGYYLPNWYNYFEQAFPNSTTYDPQLIDLNGNPVPNAAAFAQCQGHWDESVAPNRWVVTRTMTKMAAGALTVGQVRGIPVFEISPHTNYLDYIGQMHISGIYSYLYVNAHELEHNALQESNDNVPPAAVGYRPPGAPVDTDGDWIPDSIEAKYHLDPTRADTTGYYTDQNRFPEGYTYSNGDTEAICDIAGLQAVLSNPNAWKQDWSDAGVQYGARPLFSPYEYIPGNSNLPASVSPPGTAVTALPQ